MALDKVKEFFKKYNIDDRVIVLNDKDTSTVEKAAVALNTEQERIAKTLSFIVNDKPILIVMAGNTKIDNSLYKAKFKEKAHMIPTSDVLTIIGHDVGGVCPFGINDGIDVYLDNSLKKYDFVYPACGSSNSAIRLSIWELEKYSNCKEWINVTKE